ncbi:MAG: UvrD-helicase domain-containing protein, partial [Candidatus Kryptonium sp.]
MKLTKSQKQAVESQKHLAVTASAGSGKTTVLIAKYVKILEDLMNERLDTSDLEDLSDIVESVVVITFTEKAGSELRRRATEAIENKIKEALEKNDLEKLRNFEKLRDAMPSAIIGTIHSFCARILREFPITAGVDPNFVILEGAERDQVIDIIIEEKVKKFIERGDKNSENLFEVIERMKINNFYKFMKKLVSSRELVEKIKDEIYSKDSSKILERWENMIRTYVYRVFRESSMVGILSNLSKGVFSGNANFANKAGEFEWQVKSNIVEEAYKTFNYIVSKFISKIFKKDGKLSSKAEEALEELPEVERTKVSQMLSIIKRVYKDIVGLRIDEFEQLKGQQLDHIEKIKVIISLYDEINQEYENYKIQNGYL